MLCKPNFSQKIFFNILYSIVYIKLCLWHHYDAVLDSSTGKIATWAIHSGSGYSTGIQYRMHVNTPIETLYGQNFSSISIQYWYTGLVYSTGCMWTLLYRYTLIGSFVVLSLPKSKLKTFVDPAFSVRGPKLWYDLPDFVKASTSTSDFKNKLKTH